MTGSTVYCTRSMSCPTARPKQNRRQCLVDGSESNTTILNSTLKVTYRQMALVSFGQVLAPGGCMRVKTIHSRRARLKTDIAQKSVGLAPCRSTKLKPNA